MPSPRPRRTGHRGPDPDEPGLADRGDDPVAAPRLATADRGLAFMEASPPSSAYVAGRCWVFSLRRPCRGHHQHALGLLIARNSFTKLRYVRMKSCSLLYM